MEVADLSQAIRDQDIDGVRRVLDSGQFSLDEYESGRLPPVIECVSSGGRDDEDDAKRSEILRLLVQYGANVDIRTQALREFFSGAVTAVMVAAKRGLLNCLEVLVESSADLSVTSPRGDTAIMLAVRRGLVDCVKYLAEQMSPSMLNHRNRRGQTALMLAASDIDINNILCLHHLILAGADIDMEDRNGKTALTKLMGRSKLTNSVKRDAHTHLNLAISIKSVAIVKLLLQKNVDIDTKTKTGQTPLMLALRYEFTDAVPLLLDRGAEVNVRTETGDTPLTLALSNKFTEAVPLLLDRGAEVNVRTETEDTPLTLALSNKFTEAVPLLLDRGAEVNVRMETEDTPLTLAVSCNYTDIVSLLLARGAGTNENFFHPTPLIIAAKNNSPEIVSLLIENGADVNGVDPDDTPLMIAFKNNSPEVASLLIQNGADVNEIYLFSDTPLTFALENNSPEVALLLIQNGADVNRINYIGETSLMIAARNKSPEVASLLIQNGADVNRINDIGETSLMIAARKKSPEVASLLIQNGADVNEVGLFSDTPLIFAVENYSPEVALLPIQNGADVNGVNLFGYTPLMMAAQNNSPEVASFLIQNGALVNGVDRDGDTPLMIAARNNSPEVASLLIQNGADVSVSNHVSQTPYSTVTKLRSFETIAAQMIEKGADIHSVTFDGISPFITVLSRTSDAALTILLEEWPDDVLSSLLFFLRYKYRYNRSLALTQEKSSNAKQACYPSETLTRCRQSRTAMRPTLDGRVNLRAVLSGYISVIFSPLRNHRSTKAMALLLHRMTHVKSSSSEFYSLLMLVLRKRYKSLRALGLHLDTSGKVKTVLDHGHTRLVQVLRSKFRSVKALTPLFTNGFDRGVCLALQSGAKINAVATCGRTLLSRCIDGRMKTATDGNTILKLLRLGLDPTLSRRDRSCLHMMVDRGREDVVRALVVNGFPPLDLECDFYIESPSGETSQVLYQPISPLAVAILNLRSSVAVFLAKNLFFTRDDIVRLGRDPEIRQHLEYKLGLNESSKEYRQARQCMNILNELSENPQSLQTLSLIAISSALSQDLRRDRGKWICRPTFREKVGRLEIPSVFKRKLLHQPPSHRVRSHPWSDLPVKEKLCFPPQNCQDCRVVDGSMLREDEQFSDDSP